MNAMPFDYSAIRGFNYQPSYGSSGMELWRRFDADIIRKEIGRGKKFFPKMNAVRFWRSPDAFAREPEVFALTFEKALAIFADYGLQVMPVLFNRWHDLELDYGGVYIDHFTPDNWAYRADLYDTYVREIVGSHRNDPRIFVWDLCNEPCPGNVKDPALAERVTNEYNWLERMYRLCKEVGATAPLTIGTWGHGEQAIHWEPLSDIITFHPYAVGAVVMAPSGQFEFSPEICQGTELCLDHHLALAEEKGKPLLVTETCWGSTNDKHRVEIIKYILGELKKRKIGWLAYVLHHSQIADAHRAEFGPVGHPGNLSFIEADGTLRPGHEVFNDY